MISFITPVYNEEKFLPSLFNCIEKNYHDFEFEWIFIDDHSTDKSFEILTRFAENKKKITLIKNSGKGKIHAINSGFKIAKGNLIKLVGGDDEIDLKKIKNINFSEINTSYLHSANIVDIDNLNIGTYIPPYQVTSYEIDKYFLENISCPSWCWIFPKKIAEKFFPIPNCKYEDLYLSFCLKKFSNIKIIKDNFYSYRQNEGQTFGHILKFNKAIGQFRYTRSFKSLSAIKNCKIFSIRERYLIGISRKYYFLYIKDKNFFTILLSDISFQRKIKLVIFRYFSKNYSIFQKFKYALDKIYHKKFSNNINQKNKKNLQEEQTNNSEIINKKLILIKSGSSYPTEDGFTSQFYKFLNYFSNQNKHKVYLFRKNNFDKEQFLKKNINIKKIKIIDNYPGRFSLLTINLLLKIVIHKVGFKNSLFTEFEKISKYTDYKFYIHDISLYPLLFLKIDKEKIIFSLTDFQTNRLFKLIFVTKFPKPIYYFIGFIHCFFIELIMFRRIKKLHVYSKKDKDSIKKYLGYKNIISIPNFIYHKKNPEISMQFKNFNKILIMGDLKIPEVFKGIEKFKNIKNFNLINNRYIFVFKGVYDDKTKSKIRKSFRKCEFHQEWLSEEQYLSYLGSFRILLFLDVIDFGLSNRVIDALNSKCLALGFKSAFTGYNLKNYKEVIFLKKINDLIKAYQMNNSSRDEIILNANLHASNYNIDRIKSAWNKIL